MGARWKATAGAVVVGLVGSATILLLAVLFDSSGQEVAVPNRIDSPSPQQASSRPTTQARADTLAPDDDYEAVLRNARFSTRGWKIDFSRHSIPYNEILSGGPPRDGIPPIDNPRFVTPKEAAAWLTDVEPVIALEVGGEAKSYPLQILTWHEIVNATIGGVPVVATFCPLCNSAIVFDRRLNGTVYDFGTSGNLQFSNLIMWDRQTESWWQQFIGDAIVGELTGQRLDFLSATIISFADFTEARTDGQVLSRETGFAKAYGRNPYSGYNRAYNNPFLYRGESDDRLLPKERVVAVTVGDVDAAFPLTVLEKKRVISYPVNGQDLVVFFKPGTTSPLYRDSIKDSRDMGATGVFDPNVDGRVLTFRPEGDGFVDNETGTV